MNWHSTDGDETPISIGRWMLETFPGGDAESPAKPLRALKEMVELCLAAGARPADIAATVSDCLNRVMAFEDSGGGQKTHESRPAKDKIPGEVADVCIVLYGYAHIRHIDLQTEINRKMAVNRKRKWRTFGDGTGQHIPDGEITTGPEAPSPSSPPSPPS